MKKIKNKLNNLHTWHNKQYATADVFSDIFSPVLNIVDTVEGKSTCKSFTNRSVVFCIDSSSLV